MDLKQLSLVDVGTPADQAKVIGEMVDANNDGHITTHELHALLQAQEQSGMTPTLSCHKLVSSPVRRRHLPSLAEGSARYMPTPRLHPMQAQRSHVKLTPVMIASVARALAHAK